MKYQEPLKILERRAVMLNAELVKELQTQGHTLTGALEASVATHVMGNGEAEVFGVMAGYGEIVDAGVTPERIPYGGAKTGATTSLYIQGLVNFWRLKGLPEKEALRAAFATARIHKKEGMPSAGSFEYTKDGLRVDFVDVAEKKSAKMEAVISSDIDVMVDRYYMKEKDETI